MQLGMSQMLTKSISCCIVISVLIAEEVCFNQSNLLISQKKASNRFTTISRF